MDNRMKRIAAAMISAVTLSAAVPAIPGSNQAEAAGKLLAFPGAVGGGRYATGGRGGEVYHVTNLNDSGAGSFRDAVSKSGRIVVFDVSGTIELKGNILCQSNITIAGQTAPGGSGITLKNYKMGMSGNNIICRYISSRPGPYAATSSGNDAWGGAAGSDSIIDHCSMGWTTDEQWGLYSNNTNYTVQYSVLGPADSWGGHKKGLHGFGIMLGKGSLTFDHNLIIHNVSRNFRGKVPGTEVADFTNNVIYDWGYQTAYGTIGHLNYVNNTLKAGKSTTGGYHWMYVDSTTKPENFKVYCSGNRMINKDGSINGITNDNWQGVTVKESIGITKDNLYSAQPFAINSGGENISSVQGAESAEASFDHVVSFAGNGIAPDKRTAIDQQCAADAKNGTGSCSGTSEYDASVTNLDKYSIKCGVTYTYPSAVKVKEITDADNDGMDDAWELARGLDPTDPGDYSGDYCGQGYMNIEYYINDLTVDSFPEGVVQLSPESAEPSVPVPAISAFETIQAEDHSSQEGIRVEESASGMKNIGFVENGDWIMFRKVDFDDGAHSFTARASGNPAEIEICTDSPTASPAAKVKFRGTSGFTDYQDITWGIPEIRGVHDLYIRFTGGEGYLLNMDSFVFGKDAVPLSGKLFRDVEVTEQADPASWEIEPDAAVGSLIFGDRDFRIAELQSDLAGAEILLTSCDAKGTTGDAASFTAGSDMSLYVGLDSRVENVPQWLSDYTLMRTLCTSDNNVTFMMYRKDVKAGEKVVLGSNGQTYQCVNYIVMAVSNEMQAEPETEAVTEPVTEEITEPATSASETEPKKIVYGDANGDDTVNVADAVAVLQYTANKAKYPLDEFRQYCADIDGVPGLTGTDAITIQKVDAGLIDRAELPLHM